MIALSLALVIAPLQSDARLDLVCGGGGSANKSDTSFGRIQDDAGGSATATVTRRRTEGFDAQVDVWVEGATGKIRLPRSMLPPVHGGDDGWFNLKNVRTTDQEITASATVNFMNSPKIYIDRRTGVISIDGKAGHYTGQCQRVDPNARRF